MRILIISPHFPPVNAPDMHRVRLLIPHFVEAGVEIEVLTVEASQATYPSDPQLMANLPSCVPIHRVRALGLHWRRFPGLGSIGFRSLRALARRGDTLLAERHFDLIYFSTTVFEVHWLGVRWNRKFGIPFMMDFQDPWVNDYYRKHPHIRPPGGRLKYGLMNLLHRWMEPRVLRQCSGIISVSPAYPVQLAQRYPWLEITDTNPDGTSLGSRLHLPARVMPFPGDSCDLDEVVRSNASQSLFKPDDGRIHWVYAGVFIPGMIGTLRALFEALQKHASNALLDRLQIHFIGTSYVPGSAPVIPHVAREYGLERLVDEKPGRVTYTEVLACLRDANALLVLGSNDAGYTASKVYPYLLARKPLLAIMHQSSSVVTLMSKVRGSVCVPFSNTSSQKETAMAIREQWLKNDRWQSAVQLDEMAFQPYTAKYQARELADFFQTVVPQTT